MTSGELLSKIEHKIRTDVVNIIYKTIDEYNLSENEISTIIFMMNCYFLATESTRCPNTEALEIYMKHVSNTILRYIDYIMKDESVENGK